MNKIIKVMSLFLLSALWLCNPALASTGSGETLDLTSSTAGIAAVIIFVVSYMFVMGEEFIHLRKSKPVLVAAGIIWIIIGITYAAHDIPHAAEAAVRHNILEYAELFLFLLVAMTYINAMQERHIFDALRSWLVRAGYGYRQLFWLTGVLSFLISPIADNLTTALLMCAVVLAVGKGNSKFIAIACINIVIAANAGGAFSPFGDITTLMVWQKGIVGFWTFFALFLPSLVNWLVPAAIMHFAVPDEKPEPSDEVIKIRRGGYFIIFLFAMTIFTAVSFHNFLYLPPMVGMMMGLAYLKLFAFYLKKTYNQYTENNGNAALTVEGAVPFDIFNKIAQAEWDTLLFFYGVILCVGGLGFMGYLAMVSEIMYIGWGATYANIFVGFLSAIVDNIPVMFAVLTMHPDMSLGQWMLVTLTAGVGGSMLSIGSAAGVALMGQARGHYTFFSHLKWTWAIALGYAASIAVHFVINAHMFDMPALK